MAKIKKTSVSALKKQMAASKGKKSGWAKSPAKGGTPPGTLNGKASKAPGKSTNWANYDKSGASKFATWAKGAGSGGYKATGGSSLKGKAPSGPTASAFRAAMRRARFGRTK